MDTSSLALTPPNDTDTSVVRSTTSWVTGGPSRPPDRGRGRGRRLLLRWEASLEVPVEGAAGPVGDLDEPTREVEEQHEQAEARRQERHDRVAGNERGQPDDPEGAEHGADGRAHAADDDHGDEGERALDEERSDRPKDHLLGDAAEQATTDPGDPAGQGERPQLRRRRSNRVARRRNRGCPARRASPGRRRSGGGARAARRRAPVRRRPRSSRCARSEVETEQLAPREGRARRVAAAEDVEVVDPRRRRDRERERRDRQQQAGHPQGAGAERDGQERGERGGDQDRHHERDAVQLEVQELAYRRRSSAPTGPG